MAEEQKDLYINEKEIEVSEMDFLISRTDLDGHITYASDDFCKICGYTKEELKGKPHNIVRHPDMPKIAFEEMWKTIRKGKKWQGIVKNRSKDGNFYWVEAEVSPFVKGGKTIGFKSVRKRVEKEVATEAAEKYLAIAKKEQGIVDEWRIPPELLQTMNGLVDTYHIPHEKLMDQMLKFMSRRLAALKKKK